MCLQSTEHAFVWAMWAGRKGKEGCVPCFEKPRVASIKERANKHMDFRMPRIWTDINYILKDSHVEPALCSKIWAIIFFLTRNHNLNIVTCKCSLILDLLIVKWRDLFTIAASSPFNSWIKSECLGSVPTHFRDATSHLRAPISYDSSLPTVWGKMMSPGFLCGWMGQVRLCCLRVWHEMFTGENLNVTPGFYVI